MFLRSKRCWVLGAVISMTMTSGCYEGSEEEGKEAPPGTPGGWCLETLTCDEASWVCDKEGLYCYDLDDPCSGVHCGWNGACVIGEESKPTCVCDAGYSNEMFSLYCTGPDGASGGSATF